MSPRWRWFSVLLLAAILFLATGTGGFILLRSRGPKKPQPFPIADYAYAGELAEYRLEQLMKQHHIPGASAALIVDQQIVWQESFGLADIDQEIPVTGDTIFKLWSLAKPFTAVETMRLAEEGLIDLDAPITDYLPDFTIHSRFPKGETITIRHILAHRSGLPRNACVRPDWHFGTGALDRLAVSLEDCYLAYPTGERYKYGNVSYETLGYIIQDIRGQPFPVYMHDHLLAPLEMENSTFWSGDLFGVGQLNEAQKATGYEYYKGEHYAYEQVDIARIPSSNLYATIGDLASFVRFIFRDGEANGAQIINPETLAAMFEDQYSRPADPQRMGLGWKIGPPVGTEAMIWHDGGPGEGIGSLVAMLPESKLGVILLANSTSFEGSVSVPLAIELLETMSETAYGPTAAEVEQRDTYPLETTALEAYQGDYAVMGQIMTVYANGDQLKGSISGMSFDLDPVGKNRFRVTHWLVKLGLAALLQLPMDLSELEIEFQPGLEAGQDILIINFSGISYEMGPRYPSLPEIPAAWETLAGTYARYDRLASGNAGREKLGENEITIENGRLHMSGAIGPIWPIDDAQVNSGTIIILSGPFAGETITRDPQTGNLYHQGFVFKPKGNEDR